MSERLQILCGDAAVKLAELSEGSIDLILTSPPYDSIRTYGGFHFDFEKIATAMTRVLRDGGVICWNVNDATVDGSETLTSCKQKIFFREQCGLRIHDTMIYGKSNGSKPNPLRYNQVFEYVFVLSKGQPSTVNLIRDKPNVTAGKSVFGKHTMREKDGSMTVRKNRLIAAEVGVRGNVWFGNTRGQEDVCQQLPHPAMMPRWLARDLILSWSNPNDTVCDPMAGGGTTLEEAIKVGRKAIGIDINPDYVREMQGILNSVTPGFTFA